MRIVQLIPTSSASLFSQLNDHNSQDDSKTPQTRMAEPSKRPSPDMLRRPQQRRRHVTLDRYNNRALAHTVLRWHLPRQDSFAGDIPASESSSHLYHPDLPPERISARRYTTRRARPNTVVSYLDDSDSFDLFASATVGSESCRRLCAE
jgi:hypothetical protein